MWLLGILAAGLLFFWFLGRLSSADPKRLAKLSRMGAGAGIAALGLFLEMRGAGMIGLPLMLAGLGLMGFEQFAPPWLRRAPSARPGPTAQAPRRGGMSRAEAFSILGLPPDADEEAVKSAHRRLMKIHHPDHGGDVELAARINAAKELLIG